MLSYPVPNMYCYDPAFAFNGDGLGARWLARWERSTARAPIGQTELTAECERLLRLHPQFAGLGPETRSG